ncbi:MAG: SDR family oxidoreductase [Rhodospirillales bacterium]|nr:SDR family oxidoreductase [Rhodospirillales bacterium]
MADRLKDKVVIVTGCGSVGPGWGNGKAMAVLFAREGAHVIGIDRSEAAAEETRAIIAAEGGSFRARVADVSNATQIAAIVDDSLKALGRIDILINNVGIARVGGPVELDENAWDDLLRINLKSTLLTCRHVLPVMERQGKGAIVNNASIAAWGWCGVNYGLYGASKGAMISLTRSIAVQYAPKGIRANCVCPGLMNTPLVHKALTTVYGEEGDIDTLIATRDAQCPMGHMGDAWDTAHAALYLASDEAKYVTGVALNVDGGLTLRFA